MGIPWLEAEKEYIENHYGIKNTRTMKHDMYKRFRIHRSVHAIRKMARKLKCNAFVTGEGYSVWELSRVTGLKRTAIMYRVKVLGIELVGTGLARFVPFEEVDRIVNLHKDREGMLNTSQVAKILNYSRDRIGDLAAMGRIPGIKIRNRWQFKPEDIQKIKEKMSEAG